MDETCPHDGQAHQPDMEQLLEIGSLEGGVSSRVEGLGNWINPPLYSCGQCAHLEEGRRVSQCHLTSTRSMMNGYTPASALQMCDKHRSHQGILELPSVHALRASAPLHNIVCVQAS